MSTLNHPQFSAEQSAPRLSSLFSNFDFPVSFSPSLDSDIQVEEQDHSAVGEFKGTLSILTADSFVTGEVGCGLRLRGPWSSLSIVKPDGSPWRLGDWVYRRGISWQVHSINQTTQGVYGVNFTACTHLMWEDRHYEFPQASYSGSFLPGQPHEYNPLKAEILAFVSAIDWAQPKFAASTYY